MPDGGFYAWASRELSPRCVDDAYLADTIREIHPRSRCTYGAPRVHGQLCLAGTRVGRKRVARLMAELELVGVHSRKKWRRGVVSSLSPGQTLELSVR